MYRFLCLFQKQIILLHFCGDSFKSTMMTNFATFNHTSNSLDFGAPTFGVFHFMVHQSLHSCSNITCLESDCHIFENMDLEKKSGLLKRNSVEHNLLRQLYYFSIITLFLASFNAFANGFSFVVFQSRAFERSVMSRLLMGLSLYEVLFQVRGRFQNFRSPRLQRSMELIFVVKNKSSIAATM